MMPMPVPPTDPVADTGPIRMSVPSQANWFIARILVDGIDGLCVVSDLTAVGAKVMSVIPLAVDARVVIDLGERRLAAGQVHWADPTRCGVEFDPPLAPALVQAAAAGTTPAPRFKRCVPVTIERHGRQATAQLVEISPTGACLELAHEPWIREGAELEVLIEGFYPAEADVRWVEDQRIAVDFRTPIQLWRLDNQLHAWARECDACPVRDCHRPIQDPER